MYPHSPPVGANLCAREARATAPLFGTHALCYSLASPCLVPYSLTITFLREHHFMQHVDLALHWFEYTLNSTEIKGRPILFFIHDKVD
jgi:hypothetical protein